MTPLKPLIDRCKHACRVALEEGGFRQESVIIGGQRFQDLVIDVNEDVFGFAGPGAIARRKLRSVELNVVVGVHHVPLEMKVAEIRGLEVPKRYAVPATIAKHLGYLTPRGRYTPWWFSEDSDVEGLAREMAQCVVEYAFPFYQEHSTLAAVYESMKTRKYGGSQREFGFRLPVAALMLGKLDAARVHIAERHMQVEKNSEFLPAERLPIPREVGIGFRLASPADPGAVGRFQEFANRVLRLIEEAEASDRLFA